MIEEWKSAWVQALRSGKYTQARESLTIKEKGKKRCFCVLGVLNEISGLGSWDDCASYVVEKPDWHLTLSWINMECTDEEKSELEYMGIIEKRETVPFFEGGAVETYYAWAPGGHTYEETADAPRLLQAAIQYKYEESGVHPEVVKLVGLDCSDPTIGEESISYLNDYGGMTFGQLASMIEEEL